MKKLGIKAGQRVRLVDAPPGYDGTLGALPDGVRLLVRAGPADVVQVFVTRRRDLDACLPTLAKDVFPDGAVWVSWPKRASGVATDVTEDVVREVALPLGLVDVKVCAVDATWSGLKLVHRRENR